MKAWKNTVIALGLGLAALPAAAPGPAMASEHANPIFGYSHLAGSPFTVRAGHGYFGTSAAFGLTDFLQVGTDVLRDAFRIYNAEAKANLFDTREAAVAVTAGYESYNYKDISSSNPDLKVTSILPGFVGALELAPRVALFVAGNLSFSQTELKTSGIDTSGYLHGSTVYLDFSNAYSKSAEAEGRVGNVVAAGMSYDTTYGIAGFGLSHHWPGLHLGFHYYPNATRYQVLPIIDGGVAFDL